MLKGRPDLARQQLQVIQSLCGNQMRGVLDLAAAIDRHPNLIRRACGGDYQRRCDTR